jgi:hypothetical protein
MTTLPQTGTEDVKGIGGNEENNSELTDCISY